MILARVMGTVVATRKDERLLGKKLLVCRPVNRLSWACAARFFQLFFDVTAKKAAAS